MPAYVDIREGIAEAFDVLSEEFHPETVLKLANASGSYDEFDELLTISSKRFFEFTDFRKTLLLEIADDSTALTEAMEVATHVLVDDVPYEIDRGDITAPASTDVTWKITATLFPDTKRFSTLSI